ncbi:hypothetical protein TNCV_3960601 [Trichonephila clavipes]|nr:hypothetical protein TNCV_3960601 [Trichonephila clavipes]
MRHQVKKKDQRLFFQGLNEDRRNVKVVLILVIAINLLRRDSINSHYKEHTERERAVCSVANRSSPEVLPHSNSTQGEEVKYLIWFR